MSRVSSRRLLAVAAVLPSLAVLPSAVAAQDSAQAVIPVAGVEFTQFPDSIPAGDSARMQAVAIDSAGKRIDAPVFYVSTNRRAVTVDQKTGMITALKPGVHTVIGVAPQGEMVQPIYQMRTVRVTYPPVKTITLARPPAKLYAGTTVRLGATAGYGGGVERKDASLRWSSSDRTVVDVAPGGQLMLLKPGRATVTAQSGEARATQEITVVANPARTLVLEASQDSGRTGDVITFTARALDGSGKPVPGYPVTFSVRAEVEDTVIAPGAPAQVDQQGKFVANRAGLYTVIATGGNLVAQRAVPIGHRYNSNRLASAVGQGRVADVHTSDIWVWTGKDGRDYAITGTWGGDGKAYFWDVTDPAGPVKTDSVQVDARTVNDVKVDSTRGICVISREGASNRRNGLVVVDCSDPKNVEILSNFDEELTGGVHNVFLWNNHVFAINAGQRFDIISLEDPRAPRRVSFFKLDREGAGIHDVWVVDGIAYASQWQDGVILVDVGNGIAGGSLEKPVMFSSYQYPIGATHSAFPYKSKTAGDRFYVFVGDEQFPYGLDPDVAASAEAGGYIHIVDFTDVKNPVEVARYQVPEAGPHNFWIQNDTLYVAYYNAGLRVVDISGELKGNLYDQGREIARYKAFDPEGKVANTPMAWGPQPHRGHIFFSDFNSGLWAVKLPEGRKELTP